MKVHVAHSGRLALAERLEVRRLMASLEPDASFGTAGIASSPFPDGGIAVAELADQKIVVVGSTSNTTPNLSMARFTSSGALDATFGANGVAKAFDVVSLGDAIIQTDGSAIVAGRNTSGFFVAKLKPDGTPDPAFSGDGIAPLDDKIPGDATPADLDVNAAGKIVIGGSTPGGGSFVIRLKSDGSTDKTFSGDGLIYTSTGGIAVVASLDDGRVLAGNGSHQLMRYTATGGVDTTFATSGGFYIQNPRALAVQDDGQFILVTVATTGSGQFMEVARYASDAQSVYWLDSWPDRRSAASIAISPLSGIVSLSLDQDRFYSNYGAEIVRYGPGTTSESIPLGSTLRGYHLAPTGVDGLIFIGVNGSGGLIERFSPPAGPVNLIGNVLFIRGTEVADTVGLTIKSGQLRVRVNGALNTFPQSNVTRIEVYAAEGNDVVDFSGISIPTYVDAGLGNDLVTAGSGKDSLTGGAGKDTLYGGEGDDRVNGNGTQDNLLGEGGNDRIYGGAHNDYIDGGGGVDRIWGEAGNDTLCGAGSNDKIDGGLDDDSILGGKGNDLLTCGGGVDELFGNDDDDTFATTDDSHDIIDGGLGNDQAQADELLDQIKSVENTA